MEGDTFKSNFYQLQGDALKERRKNFFKLLKSTDFNISDYQLDIQPRNFLEELFYVEALIYFRRTNPLLKVFKNGNDIFVSKIIKEPWFFKDLFKNVNEDMLVNEILPTYSYSLRMKVLNRLSRILDDQQLDKVFDLILKRYGHFVATKFLARCSLQKIQCFIKHTEVDLNSTQVEIIYNRDPETFLLYCQEYHKNFGKSYYDEHLFVYIFQTNPNLALKLSKELNTMPQLGKRITKRLIKTNEKEIVADLKKVLPSLHKSMAVRTIKGFDKLLVSFFPERIEDLNSCFEGDISPLIKCYPQVRQWKLFAQTFMEIYLSTVTEHLTAINRYVLKYAPLSVVQEWAEKMYSKSDDIGLTKYMEAKKSIPILKEKINLTSILQVRYRLLYLLIDVCSESKDWESLENVLKYICFRHRNEEHAVRFNLLCLIKDTIDHKALNSQHWKYILELLELHRIREEPGFKTNFYLFYRHLEYLYRNGNPQRQVLQQYVEDVFTYKRSLIIESEDDFIKKQILEDIAEILLHMSDKYVLVLELLNEIVEHNGKSSHFVQASKFPVLIDMVHRVFVTLDQNFIEGEAEFISNVLKYNQQDAQNPFNLPPSEELLKILITVSLTKKGFPVCQTISCMIKKQNRNPFEDELVKFYFSNSMLSKCNASGLTKSVVQFFLQNEPQIIVKYYDAIMALCFRDVLFDKVAVIKKYSHLNLDARLINNIKTRLDLDKADVITALLILMPAEDFLKYVELYIPQSSKLDITDKTQKDMYKIRCDIVKEIRKAAEPCKFISFLMNFCQGDYLQSSLPSLYSFMYRIPENELSGHITILANGAVSVRKHALFLSAELLPVPKVQEIFQNLAIEENASNFKYGFSSLFKYFVKNTSDDIFDFLILNLCKINENDSEILEMISSKPKIPKKYLPLYVEKVWYFFEVLRRKDTKVELYQASLLDTMLTILPRISVTFCNSIIQKYFLEDGLLGDKLNLIVAKYLQVYPEEKYFIFIFEILGEIKKKRWDSTGIRRVFNFFDNIYSGMYECENVKFILLFKQFWEQQFTDTESFTELLLLKLMIIYQEDKFSLENFTLKVNSLMDKLAETYQLHVISFVSTVFRRFFSLVPYNQIESVDFISHLIHIKPCLPNYILAANLLQFRKRSSRENKINNILKILANVSDPVVQMECRKCLLNL
ncbi:uncharacterized protein LOC132705475 [Cylas formicarius]|uniref:uncharacterized protein LOC132705475 n=1 Tax=Cylas formicarius TaxID=197179 RepID=UPI0029585116|nr:uncharacterized protein LOC132705475 [Cylas formicarius]